MICIDASVAVKIVLDEERSDLARSLYSSMVLTQEAIVAPPLLPIEVTNIMRQQMRRQKALSLIETSNLPEEFLALPITIHNPAELHLQALRLADAHGLAATYDAHYLALAELLGCELWTADQRLVRQVINHLPFVRWLGDYILTAGV